MDEVSLIGKDGVPLSGTGSWPGYPLLWTDTQTDACQIIAFLRTSYACGNDECSLIYINVVFTVSDTERVPECKQYIKMMILMATFCSSGANRMGSGRRGRFHIG